MSKSKQRLGAKGERLALQFLRRRGYKIVAQNFSCRLGEIDIIAREGKIIVFIEVKTRSSCEFGLPEEAIGKDKIRSLLRCAQFYINNYANAEAEFRFDLVTVLLENALQINLIKDIF